MPTQLLDERRAAGLRDVVMEAAAFARGMLGHDIWDTQAAILQAMNRPHARVAVKGCHASTKTFAAAELVLWWLVRFQQAIAVTTSATGTQVEKEVWGEIHKAIRTARVAYPPLNLTELRFAPDRYAIGISTNEAERFHGFHADHVLIVVDEAPGVRPPIWEAIEGIRAGGDVRVLALGNPTIASGPFYDAFSKDRAGWQTFTINAFDTPNLRGLSLEDLLALPEHELDVAPRPYLVTRRYVAEKYAEWGPEHPLWQARVLGQFPTQAEDALVSLAWLEAAKYREAALSPSGWLCAGLDVAGPGEDETVLVIREGSSISETFSWRGADPRGDVLAALLPYKERLQTVNVDSVGIGYYMLKHLGDAGLPVLGVNVGEAASDTEKFVNRKAELYWGMRQRFQAGDVAGLTDETAIAQLAGIRYSHNARGQVVIESKDDARKRGVRSPDRAEAIMLAFAGSDSHVSFQDLQEMMQPQDKPLTVVEQDARDDERVEAGRVF